MAIIKSKYKSNLKNFEDSELMFDSLFNQKQADRSISLIFRFNNCNYEVVTNDKIIIVGMFVLKKYYNRYLYKDFTSL